MKKIVGLGLEINPTKGTVKELAEVELRLQGISKELRKAKKEGDGKTYARLREEQIKTQQVAGDLRKEIRNQVKDFKAAKFPTDSLEGLRLQYRKLRREIDGLSEADPRLDKLSRQANELSKRINSQSQRIGDFRNNIGNYKSAFIGAFGAIQKAVPFLAIAGGLSRISDAAAQSITIFADFKEQIALLGAVSKASASDLAVLEAEAKRLGETTFFTASEVAELQTNFARAGFSPKEIIDVTEATLDLAVATGEDLNSSSEVVAESIRAYGLEADQASRFTDVLTETLNTSNNKLEDFRESSKLLAPISNTLGISVEESAAAIGILGDNGLKGSIATTTLSSGLTRLADSSGKYAKQAKELGVEVFNQSGEFVGLAQLLQNVEAATEGMTEQQRLATISQVFGQKATKNFAALLNAQKEVVTENGTEIAKGGKALELYTQQLEGATGAAAKAADTVGDTLSGDFKSFRSAVEGLQIRLTSVFEPFLRGVTQAGTSLIRTLGPAIELVLKLFKPLVDAVKNFFSQLFQGTDVSDAISKRFQFFANILAFTVNVIATIINSFTEYIKTVRNVVSSNNVLSGFFDAFRNIAVQVTDAIVKIPAVLNGVLEATKQFGKNLRNLDFSDGISDAYNKGFTAAQMKAEEANLAISESSEKTKDSITAVGSQIQETFEVVETVAVGAIAKLENEIKSLNEQLEKAPDKTAFSRISQDIDQAQFKLEKLKAEFVIFKDQEVGVTQTLEFLPTIGGDDNNALIDDALTDLGISPQQLARDAELEEEEEHQQLLSELRERGEREQTELMQARAEERRLLLEDDLKQKKEIFDSVSQEAQGIFTQFLEQGNLTFQEFQKALLKTALKAIANRVRIASVEILAQEISQKSFFGAITAGILIGVVNGAFAALSSKIESFATGGVVQGIPTLTAGRITTPQNIKTRPNGDNVLAFVKRRELIFNETHQERAKRIYGDDIFHNIGIPGFAGGGLIGDTPQIVNPNRQTSIQPSTIEISPENMQLFAAIVTNNLTPAIMDATKEGTQSGYYNAVDRQEKLKQLEKDRVI